MLRNLISAAVLTAALFLPGSALADPNGNGPGACDFPPGGPGTGTSISLFAKAPGPNAGPNSLTIWGGAPGTPNAPGQAVKDVCL